MEGLPRMSIQDQPVGERQGLSEWGPGAELENKQGEHLTWEGCPA